MNQRSLAIAGLVLILVWIVWYVWKTYLYPRVYNKLVQEVDRNPDWIMKDIKDNFYGFQNMDIVVIKPSFISPSIRVAMNDKGDITKFEYYVCEDVSAKDAEEIAKQALMAKVYVLCGKVYSDKPLYWLSILCYMLEGRDINEKAVSYEEKK